MTMARPMEIKVPVDQTSNVVLGLSEQKQGQNFGNSLDDNLVGDPDAGSTSNHPPLFTTNSSLRLRQGAKTKRSPNP